MRMHVIYRLGIFVALLGAVLLGADVDEHPKVFFILTTILAYSLIALIFQALVWGVFDLLFPKLVRSDINSDFKNQPESDEAQNEYWKRRDLITNQMMNFMFWRHSAFAPFIFLLLNSFFVNSDRFSSTDSFSLICGLTIFVIHFIHYFPRQNAMNFYWRNINRHFPFTPLEQLRIWVLNFIITPTSLFAIYFFNLKLFPLVVKPISGNFEISGWGVYLFSFVALSMITGILAQLYEGIFRPDTAIKNFIEDAKPEGSKNMGSFMHYTTESRLEKKR